MGSDDRTCDLIIAGAGLAGLSLVMRLIENGWVKGRKILLVDRDAKRTNDRTWCFWEQGDGYFEELVHARWDRMWFRSDHGSELLGLSPYSYKLIRGIDLYEHCFRAIGNEPGITFLQTHIDRIFSDHEGGTGITAGGKTYKAKYVLNSIRNDAQLDRSRSVNLLQHFKGWWIRTARDVFDPTIGTLMDFSTKQRNGATFFYVLPVSTNEALIEYTIFSEDLLPQGSYDHALREHLQQLRIGDHQILQEEFGVIPMTDAAFSAGHGNIINIGTAGGCTKPSTGYTFQFVQEHCASLADALVKTNDPRKVSVPHSGRSRFYDAVFLNVLKSDPTGSDRIFSQLFMKNRPDRILRFLEGKSSFGEDLSIIGSLPTLPFLKAAIGLAWK